MADSLHARFDEFGRQNPRVMLGVTIFVAIITTLIVVYNTKDTAIVYRAF